VAAFNFRQSSGFVTDGVGQTYVLSTDAYTGSVIRDGHTFGWVSGDVLLGQDSDRNNAIDPRLAGIHYQGNNGTQSIFRYNLPASGSYTIDIALGDNNSAQAYQYLQIQDNTTPVVTLDQSSGTGAAEWYDATGTLRTSAANWVSGHVTITQSFSTAVARFVIGSPATQANSTTLSHIAVAAAGGSYNAAPLLHYYQSLKRGGVFH
jgi:hypothetical protein